MRWRLWTIACFATLLMTLLPNMASAQSAIQGSVKDTSGGALPGVSVEASSPSLIEKTRTVVTDDQGRYVIVDLRPGSYHVTFTLAGFSTLARDGIELPSGFTATVNAELQIGALEETVTVSGASPVVDVTTGGRAITIPRPLLDSVPTGRTFLQQGALVTGVKVSSIAVGGARTSTQQRITVHGTIPRETTIEVDGMKMNTGLSGGETQANLNDGLTEEVVVRTSSPGAEVSGGGLYVNLIPRSGGNTTSGSTYFGYSGKSFQGSNLTPELKSQGVVQGDGVAYTYDLNIGLGGPLKRDKLWYFFSYRNIGNGNIVTNTFYEDGRPGIYDLELQHYSGRITWQASTRNKLTVYYDRPIRNIWHDFTAGQDPLRASKLKDDMLYYTGAVKWTAPLSSKLLVDAGWSVNFLNLKQRYQHGVDQVRGTPAWYANASRSDLVLLTLKTAPTAATWDQPDIYSLLSSASYVTGSHALKTGVQWRFGPYVANADANADLQQRYRNGVPDSVLVYNTPVHSFSRLNADLGTYVQDSWKIKRLTVNPGIRFEYFNAQIEASAAPPGRFVPFRQNPAVPNLPNWFNVAPRFSTVYDLTGDGKTAVKASANRYFANDFLLYTSRYDPSGLQSESRNWSDLNKDDIAQDNEIGASNNARFGAGAARRPDPNLKRQYSTEYSVGVDRELLSGVSVNAAWYRRGYHNLEYQINTLVSPSDYVAFETINPLTNETFTMYNLDPAKQGLVNLVDTTSTDSSKTAQTYSGFDLGFSARLPGQGNLFGGLSGDQTVSATCQGFDPNTFRYCDQTTLNIPFTKDFKLVASYPLPLGFRVAGNFQSYAGGPNTITYVVPASAFPGGRRTQSVTVNLIPPGSKYLDRTNEFDMSLRKQQKFGRGRFEIALDIFNALNSSVVLSRNNSFGVSLDQPRSIMQPRVMRISGNFTF